MKWRAFATDFDGTIATDGVVDEVTAAALRKLQEAGVLMFLVTGRELKDFTAAGDILELFDAVVAENGALIYLPATGESRGLGSPPPPEFVEALKEQAVPISVGATIVATVEPHEITVLELIKDMGLELQLIFNKGAVMILPPGVNKATGLQAALEPHGIALSEVVGVGDAENDHAFLEGCGLSVAVANALPSLKERVRFITHLNAGAGVAELVELLLRGDFDEEPVEAAA